MQAGGVPNEHGGVCWHPERGSPSASSRAALPVQTSAERRQNLCKTVLMQSTSVLTHLGQELEEAMELTPFPGR